MHTNRSGCFATLIVAGALSCSAHAGIVGTGGDATLIAAPASAALGALESNTLAWTFQESTGTVLSADLAVNATTPGVYTSVASLTPGTIAAGTPVQSHYIYTDPAGNTLANYEGFADFDQPILGVIVLRSQLNASDFLGAPGTAYADNQARGMELSQSEQFVFSISGTRVSFRFATSGATDDIRVITAIPAPGAAVLLSAGSLLLARRRRACMA